MLFPCTYISCFENVSYCITFKHYLCLWETFLVHEYLILEHSDGKVIRKASLKWKYTYSLTFFYAFGLLSKVSE